MYRPRPWLFLVFLLFEVQRLWAGISPLVQRQWFENRTAHFHTYSCGDTQEVARLAARLEQFNEAYSVLAGAQAVASPPITVFAFPDHESMEPFLPLYGGKPANLAAFFGHGSDENLIVLSLANDGGDSMRSIFHEYSHLLLRHNELFWPMWLKEGMAEIYSTFEVTGRHSIRIGKPIEYHLQILNAGQFMPLSQLLSVTHESAEYNEREHQGIFYAESWLLTHYLMLGDNPALKSRFGQLTLLLRQGLSPEKAFLRAFQTPLPTMEKELRGYLERGQFKPLDFSVQNDLYAPRATARRPLAFVEVLFRLGDELLRLGRTDEAEEYFNRAKKIAPMSPFPYEGLGLAAAERHHPEEAVEYLTQALERGSVSFLAYYMSAREKYQLACHSEERFSRVEKDVAIQIRAELQKSLSLMPDFGPAHHLLGFFELVQGDDLAKAESHLLRAVQLEPESPNYLLSLAQAQIAKRDPHAARQTLEELELPYVEVQLRHHAQEMLKELGEEDKAAHASP